MIGFIAGDVAGSTYRKENTYREDFSMFATLSKSFYRPSERTWTESEVVPSITDNSLLMIATMNWLMSDRGRDIGNLKEMMQDMGRYCSKVYYPAGGGSWTAYPNRKVSDGLAVDMSRTLGIWMNDEHARNDVNFGASCYLAALPAGVVAGSVEEARSLARDIVGVTCYRKDILSQGEALAGAVWMARNGASMTEVREFVQEILKSQDIDLSRSADDVRRSAAKDGVLNEREEIVLKYTGAQKSMLDFSAARTILAGVKAYLITTDFEAAVRKAVSFGGDSPSVAAIAGALAEQRYGGVPSEIRKMAASFLDSDLKEVVESFDNEYSLEERTVRRPFVGVDTLFTEEEMKNDRALAGHVSERPVSAGEPEVSAESLDALKAKFMGESAVSSVKSAGGGEAADADGEDLDVDDKEALYREMAEREAQKRNALESSFNRTVHERVLMVRCEGQKNIWFVSEGNEVLRSHLLEHFGDRIELREPSEVLRSIEELKVDVEAVRGVHSGTYLNPVYPEVREFYFYGGKLASASTTADPSVRVPLEVRARELSEFKKLCAKVESLRSEIQRGVGYDGDGVIHFANAVNFSVGRDRIDVYRGDNLCGTVRIDPSNGLIRVQDIMEGAAMWEPGPFSNMGYVSLGGSGKGEESPKESAMRNEYNRLMSRRMESEGRMVVYDEVACREVYSQAREAVASLERAGKLSVSSARSSGKVAKTYSVAEIFQCLSDFSQDNRTALDARRENEKRESLMGSPYEYEGRRSNEEVASDDLAKTDDPELLRYFGWDRQLSNGRGRNL